MQKTNKRSRDVSLAIGVLLLGAVHACSASPVDVTMTMTATTAYGSGDPRYMTVAPGATLGDMTNSTQFLSYEDLYVYSLTSLQLPDIYVDGRTYPANQIDSITYNLSFQVGDTVVQQVINSTLFLEYIDIGDENLAQFSATEMFDSNSYNIDLNNGTALQLFVQGTSYSTEFTTDPNWANLVAFGDIAVPNIHLQPLQVNSYLESNPNWVDPNAGGDTVTNVAEPGSIALLGSMLIGLGTIGAVRKRRAQASK